MAYFLADLLAPARLQSLSARKGAIGLEIVQFARLLRDISLASMQVEVSTICNGRRKDIKGNFILPRVSVMDMLYLSLLV